MQRANLVHKDPRMSSTPRRLALALLFGLHVFAVGAAPLADAHLELQSNRAVHVESPDFECGYHHHHLICTLCRVIGLSGALTPPTLETASAPKLLPFGRLSSQQGTPSGFHRAGALGPRAPPPA